MKNKILFSAMLAIGLAFCLIFVGCDTTEEPEDVVWYVNVMGMKYSPTSIYTTGIRIGVYSSTNSSANWKKNEMTAEDVLGWLNINQSNDEKYRHTDIQGSLSFEEGYNTVAYLSFTCAPECTADSVIHISLKNDAATLSAIKIKLEIPVAEHLEIDSEGSGATNILVTKRQE
jgi:hypothetical protein